MVEGITATTREKGCTGRTPASSAARLHPSEERAAWGPFSTLPLGCTPVKKPWNVTSNSAIVLTPYHRDLI